MSPREKAEIHRDVAELVAALFGQEHDEGPRLVLVAVIMPA